MITLILTLLLREIFLIWLQSRVSVELCSVRVEDKTVFARLADADQVIGKGLCMMEVEN